MELIYTGTFKQHLLMDELLTAFPEWIIGEGDERRCLLYLVGNDQSVKLTVPDGSDVLVIEVIINAHDSAVLTAGELLQIDIEAALDGFKNLPNYATWTPAEAETHVTDAVLNGWTVAEANAWIDTNVTDMASAKTALKQIAGAVIDLRKMLSLVVKMLMWLRNIVIRTR